MTLDSLLQEYGDSHRHPTNKLIHRIAVPIIALDMLGMVRAMPRGAVTGGVAAAIVVALVVAYYARLSPRLAAVMAVLAATALAFLGLAHTLLGVAFVPLLLTTFALAWLLQFYGHALEGKRPSFFRDLQFLLIGPLWIVNDTLRHLEPSTAAPESL